MRIFLPNSANLQNITGFLSHIDFDNDNEMHFSMHPRWVAVHPIVLAMTACLGAKIRNGGGTVTGGVTNVRTLPYLIRMKLFEHLGIDPGMSIREHEESGRFIPITQIRNFEEHKIAITNLVPLLHAPPAVADPIKYVFSEMVRNALEHARSEVGVFVCAQYYSESKRIAIGIADAGRGIASSMARHHEFANPQEAMKLALQPGITGTTSRIGGNDFNAGAGLFFTKSIATLSRNRFVLYSGKSMFRLMLTRKRHEPVLNVNPTRDPHQFVTGPRWDGTVVGIDLNIEQGVEFSYLLDRIRQAYSLDVRSRRDYTGRIRFS